MSFQPVIVGGGLVGYQFLKRTQERQQEVFEGSAQIKRDAEYFAENIGNVNSAEDLVADRRLLNVALTSFGLQDDIDSKFFIQKVLEEGLSSPTSLANRLADERYKNLALEFSFDLPVANTVRSYFADEMLERYHDQAFEIAVGEQDQSLRLGLNFTRGVEDILENGTTEDAAWFRLMGTPPLRTVVETALNLPSSFSQIDLDTQLNVFRDKMASRFGIQEVSEMTDPEVSERIVQSYLVQEQANAIRANSSGQIALTLLNLAGF